MIGQPAANRGRRARGLYVQAGLRQSGRTVARTQRELREQRGSGEQGQVLFELARVVAAKGLRDFRCRFSEGTGHNRCREEGLRRKGPVIECPVPE
jgi:hypothetical protein